MLRPAPRSRDITPPLPFHSSSRAPQASRPRRFIRGSSVCARPPERRDRRRRGSLTGELLEVGAVRASGSERRRRPPVRACPAPDVLVDPATSHDARRPTARRARSAAHTRRSIYTAGERSYYETLPGRFAAAAGDALGQAKPAVVTGGVGRARGIAVNRRERTPDGRTILGWNRQGFVDEVVPVIAIADLAGNSIAMLVGFGCHRVVLGCRCGDASYASEEAHFFPVLRTSSARCARPSRDGEADCASSFRVRRATSCLLRPSTTSPVRNSNFGRKAGARSPPRDGG